MADTKISSLAAMLGTTVDPATDVLPIVDTSLTITNKILVNELLAGQATTTVFANATTKLNIGGTGATSVFAIPGTLQATGTTGALTVAGGAYIAKDVNVAGAAAVTGALTAASLSTGSGAISGGAISASGIITSTQANGLIRLGGSTATFPGVRYNSAGEIGIVLADESDYGDLKLRGMVAGAPTGGQKGSGTANFAADIYKNNTAYTNPDYVLEHWATGKIVKYADKEDAASYTGLQSLASIEQFAKQNWHLPRFGQQAGHGLFGGSDALLASVEESYLHLFDLDKRLRQLETRNPQ